MGEDSFKANQPSLDKKQGKDSARRSPGTQRTESRRGEGSEVPRPKEIL